MAKLRCFQLMNILIEREKMEMHEIKVEEVSTFKDWRGRWTLPRTLKDSDFSIGTSVPDRGQVSQDQWKG